jgi:hypothetical protein
MNQALTSFRTTLVLATFLAASGCSSSSNESGSPVGGAGPTGGATGNVGGNGQGGGSLSGSGGAPTNGGSNPSNGGAPGSGGAADLGGAGNGGSPSSTGGAAVNGGGTSVGGANVTVGGTATGGTDAGGFSTGGAKATGGTGKGGASTGGAPTGGANAVGGATTGGTVSAGGTPATGGKATGGAPATAGTSSTARAPATGCATGDAVMTKSGSTWTVTNGGTQRYSGTDTQAALTAAYNSLTSGRTTKQTVVVQGDGDIPASAQVAMPSYTIVDWCSGTLNISGSSSGDMSPFYARSKTDVEIANLKMTGSPGYGIFFRGTNNMILGNITLNLSGGSPGIGIRIDTSGNAATDTTFVTNLTINNVTGSGMTSHIVETYGVDGIKIGTITGSDVGQCGLLLNRSINAEVDLVTCNNCAYSGTKGYAAFRVANNNGMIGSSYPVGNIHVKKVYARSGGRGIFSVSACGGLTIDSIDLASTGNTPILLQNTYNTTIAAVSGTIVGGESRVSNDTANTDPTDGRTPMVSTRNVTISNITLSDGASLVEDWCDFNSQGDVGNRAINVTGGTVDMCY